MTVAFAISKASLVIVPIQASPLDTDMAQKAVELVQRMEKGFDKRILQIVLFTRTKSAFPTNIEKAIRQDLESAEIAVFETQLNEREAYKHQFLESKTIFELDPKTVSGVAKSIANAQSLLNEVLDVFIVNDGTTHTSQEVA